MPITYPLDFPTYLISKFRIGLSNTVGRTESPFSRKEQVVQWSGQVWVIEVAIARLPRADAEVYNTFLMKLNGMFGTFLIGDPNAVNPRGSWGGTPLVKGAGQTGNDLIIDGLPTSITGVAKAGDYIQIGTGANARLHKVMDDANSNGSGESTLLIQPRLRSSPADNAPIIYTNAKGKFKLNDNLTGYDIDNQSFYTVSFSATESL